MKKLLLCIFFFFLSCEETTKQVNIEQKVIAEKEPTKVYLKDNESSFITILKEAYNNEYNEKGYKGLRKYKDDYGYTQWEFRGYGVFIFNEELVSEMKKYRTIIDFANSETGRFVSDKMRDCYIERKEHETPINTGVIDYLDYRKKIESDSLYDRYEDEMVSFSYWYKVEGEPVSGNCLINLIDDKVSLEIELTIDELGLPLNY
jgi:hypothetical protein